MSWIQLRVDDKLKEEGVLFKMTLKKDSYKAEAAVRAMREISRTAEEEGIAEMTLEEINAVRNEA